MFRQVMTAGELAVYLGIPKQRVYRMVRLGAGAGLPGFRVGRAWRVDLDEMREWLIHQTDQEAPSVPVGISPGTRR
jgi:excisionase family DNA binding protein